MSAKAASSRAPHTEPRLLRIVDANLNRAREGLRVAEEVARFYLADAALSARLKSAREAIGGWDGRFGIAAAPIGRDSESDPGRPMMGARETARDGISGLVRANLRRAEEAARVIEEVAKLADPAHVSEYKEMRYTLYSLEAELIAALERERAS